MAFVNLPSGLNVGTKSPVDKRFILTKEEMLSGRFADTGKVIPAPSHLGDDTHHFYFAVCSDDGKFYLYNDTITESAETGKFHVLEEFMDFTQSEAAQEQFEKAVEASPVIIDLTETVLDEDEGLVKKVADIQEEIQNIKIDGKVIGG